MTTAYKSNTGSDEGCVSTSSNCVIWQGPDIPCINVCRGDTITDIVYKAATLLCQIQNSAINICTTDITDCDIDYGCLSNPGNISTVKDLFQQIIDDICAIVIPPSSAVNIPLPLCLQYDDGFGAPVTTLTLANWAQLVNTKICEVEDDIIDLEVLTSTHTSQIAALDLRIDDLEATQTPAEFTVDQTCVDPTPGIGVILLSTSHANLAAAFCALRVVTGTTTDLSGAIALQTAANGDPQLFDPGFDMDDISGWIPAPTTVEDTIRNIWLTIGDIRDWAATIVCNPAPLLLSSFILSSAIVSNDLVVTAVWGHPGGTSSTRINYIVDWHKNGAFVKTDTLGPTITTTTLTNVGGITDADRNSVFTVSVKVVYDCGESETMTQVIKPVHTSLITITEAAYSTMKGASYLSANTNLAITPSGPGGGDTYASVYHTDPEGYITITVDLDLYMGSVYCVGGGLTVLKGVLRDTTHSIDLITVESDAVTKGSVLLLAAPGENIAVSWTLSCVAP